MIKQRHWALILVAAAGCGQGLPPAADPGRARAALQTSLEAWKAGQSPDALRARSPAIYFNDDAWKADARLADYAIQSEAANGQGWRCDVQMTVQSGDRPPRDRFASYQIDTDPAIVIVEQP
jgi:hypothetical protein